MKFTRILCLSFLLLATAVRGQQFTQPGWFHTENTFEHVPQQFSRDAQNEKELNGGAQGGGQSRLLSLPEIAEASTPEIQALARGLENDPKRIFDYVHDNK